MQALPEDILRLLIAIVLGMIMGIEREYRGKAAGVRTITLISFGSCLFTLISAKLGASSPDRIAANIVTGVGFLGGGVIFKDGLNVTGLTTASTIWIAAALGMSIATGNYIIAVGGLAMAIIVLSTFEYIREVIEFIRESRTYEIKFNVTLLSAEELEAVVQEQFGINHKLQKLVRDGETVVVTYEIYGRETRLNHFNEWLNANPKIKSFNY